jgi:hypothetical protein|tara:strand:- start:3167 stop:3586 length:420 start_codon:yes stop_codon:yes gene_type:complete
MMNPLLLLLAGLPLLAFAFSGRQKPKWDTEDYMGLYRLEDPDRYTPGQPQFELGQVAWTGGIQSLIDGPTAGIGDLRDIFTRHREGDWGSVGTEDSSFNDEAVVAGERILGAHELGGKKIWVITEWDRSVTTALLPGEY